MNRSGITRVFVDHIELWLSGLGLLVIWVLPMLLAPELTGRWEATAITAIAVGVIHGFIFWIVRRRRQRVIEEGRARLEEANRQLEKRVAERTEQIRSLASAATLAEQRERHVLSLRLHEDLQQLLLSGQMRTQALRAAQPMVADRELQGKVDQVEQVFERSVRTVKLLSVQLSPPVLEGEGLDPALRWLCRHMHQMHGLNVEFASEAVGVIVDEALRVLLFQLVRELLLSVVHHAKGNRAEVRLTTADNAVCIDVKSKTASLDPRDVVDRRSSTMGMGLSDIRERLRFFSGDLEVRPASGAGAHFRITAPSRVERKTDD